MAKILNLARLQRKLNRLPEVAKNTIRSAMAQAADEIVAMMKSLAPVSADGSHGNPAGTLRDSIGWTWGKPPKGASIVASVKASLGGDLTITIYAGSTEAFYARWQEFGTQNITASPYFYVSWRASKKSAKAKVRAGIRKAAKQVAAG
jgi:HK97 gp10 family phage protein